jgi:hypothetical protein
MESTGIAEELAEAYFYDLRLTKRAQKLVTDLFDRIGNSIPGSCQSRSETEAAYRFFDNDCVTPKRILNPHINATIERIKQHKFVLLIQDSTDIDAKHMKNVEGLGFLNDTTRPGCTAHTMIACTPERLCLGIVSNEFIIREKDEIGKKTHNNLRVIEEKESYKWLQAYKNGLKIAEQVPDTQFVCIGDREADIIELFIENKNANNRVALLVRAFQDRSIEIEKDDKKIKTKLKRANLDAQEFGHIEFKLQPREGKKTRKARMVKQSLKAATITIKAPTHKKHLGAVDINVIFLEEIDPPEGEDPICWTLLTTLPISTAEEIEFVVKLYLARWSIEVFFYVLKIGCKIEKLQFDTAHSLLNCVTLFMIVAWRLYFITFLGRTCPELSCTLIFEEDEWKSVFAVVKKAKPPPEPPTLGEVVRMIGTLGGFLGRKCDGYPGPKAMWIGLQKLAGCAQGWAAYREFA